MAVALPKLPDEAAARVRQIAAGQVSTFGHLAQGLGDRVAARWLGQWLREHSAHSSPELPWWRIVAADGRPTHPNRSTWVLQQLSREGVPLAGDRVDLTRVRLVEFAPTGSLARLAAEQRRIAERARFEDLPGQPTCVGGLDISYVVGQDEAVAAATVTPLASGLAEPTALATVCHRPGLPYVTGYLAFRELDLYRALLEQLDAGFPWPEVWLVDGSGVLHPRGAGIATHLGVLLDCPTVGVTKKHLVGESAFHQLAPGESQPIVWQDRVAGYCLRVGDSRRPLFISPGHRITPEAALALVTQLVGQRRLPEPIYWADRLSRQEARQRRAAAETDCPQDPPGDGN